MRWAIHYGSDLVLINTGCPIQTLCIAHAHGVFFSAQNFFSLFCNFSVALLVALDILSPWRTCGSDHKSNW